MENPQSPDLTLAGLVHDLNNVFETISEAAELLAEDDRWAKLAATIRRSVDRGRGIAGSLAEQSRASQELEPVVERIELFVQDSLTLIKHAPVKIRRRIESGTLIPGQASDWERVFMNLLLNAAQAMPDGGAVEVEAWRESKMLHIAVMDNGPGIPTTILKDIFKARFSTRSKHSGMGLHIVATMVQKYGGKVTAANREDTPGARFLINLPDSE
ncbi:MAG: HAMP domain-containing histidine kinase [Bryobacterales bacterium]|nr:HAMP domain-containing histidine kinase [Bryobacterales bacterium]